MHLAEIDPDGHDDSPIFKELSADDKARLEAQMREKAWRDSMDRFDGAFAKGLKEGRKQRDIEAVTNMHSKGVSIAQIADYLSITFL